MSDGALVVALLFCHATAAKPESRTRTSGDENATGSPARSAVRPIAEATSSLVNTTLNDIRRESDGGCVFTG